MSLKQFIVSNVDLKAFRMWETKAVHQDASMANKMNVAEIERCATQNMVHRQPLHIHTRANFIPVEFTKQDV